MLHDRKLLKKTAKIKKMRTNNAQKDRMVASCLIQVLYRPPSKPLETKRFQGVFLSYLIFACEFYQSQLCL